MKSIFHSFLNNDITCLHNSFHWIVNTYIIIQHSFINYIILHTINYNNLLIYYSYYLATTLFTLETLHCNFINYTMSQVILL